MATYPAKIGFPKDLSLLEFKGFTQNYGGLNATNSLHSRSDSLAGTARRALQHKRVCGQLLCGRQQQFFPQFDFGIPGFRYITGARDERGNGWKWNWWRLLRRGPTVDRARWFEYLRFCG